MSYEFASQPQQPNIDPAMQAWIALKELPEQNVFERHLGTVDKYTPLRTQYAAEIESVTSQGVPLEQIQDAALTLVTQEAQEAYANSQRLLAPGNSGNIAAKALEYRDALQASRDTVNRALRLGIPMSVITGEEAPTAQTK